jgi:DNA-binding response OmpR family regulator
MNHQYSDVKTILMSVKPSPDGIIRARNAGIDIYFAKPFRPSELRSRVESLLARSSAGDQENSAQDKDGPMENLRDRLKQLEGPHFRQHIQKSSNWPRARTHRVRTSLKRSNWTRLSWSRSSNWLIQQVTASRRGSTP